MANPRLAINKIKNVVYVPYGFLTGITDLVLSVRKPDGTLLTPDPIIVEQGLGVYTTSYIPDMLGNWQESITSISNQDHLVRAYDIVSYDVDDIHTQIDGVETKIDTISLAMNQGGYFA